MTSTKTSAADPVAAIWAAEPAVQKLERVLAQLEAANSRLAAAGTAAGNRNRAIRMNAAIADLNLERLDDRAVDSLGRTIIAGERRDEEAIAAFQAIGVARAEQKNRLAEARREARPRVFKKLRALFPQLVDEARPALAALAGVDDAAEAIRRGATQEWAELERIAGHVQRICAMHAELVTSSGADVQAAAGLIERVGYLAEWWQLNPWKTRLEYGMSGQQIGTMVTPTGDAPSAAVPFLRYLASAPSGVQLRTYAQLTQTVDEIRLALGEADRQRAQIRADRRDPTLNPTLNAAQVVAAVRATTGPNPDRPFGPQSAWVPTDGSEDRLADKATPAALFSASQRGR